VPPDPNELIEFNYRIFKIEYIVFKLFVFAVFLFGIYTLARHELGIGRMTAPASVSASTSACASPPSRP